VFPATYEGGKYATENRVVPGEAEPVACILLDSVQSQANRMELALLDAWRDGRITLPVISVDFGGQGLEKELRVSSLEAPHRIADALLRDSLLEGTAFRRSAVGKRLDQVDARNATTLFELCPTALVFGMWDSTGPKGGLGVKFARSLVSEIVGIGAVVGTRTSSRIDPAAIAAQAGPLYQAAEGAELSWTLDAEKAQRDKKGPMKLGKDGRPSEANHSNVTPTIADGGITIERARQTTVISLPGLRRLRFPVGGRNDRAVDEAARTALAALALCAASLVREQGCDLRSRCHLVPTSGVRWELLDGPGDGTELALDSASAVELYAGAVAAARAAGLPWMERELTLQPHSDLVELVRRSQALAVSTGAGDGGE
jgi:CRISPR-associated protein Csb1